MFFFKDSNLPWEQSMWIIYIYFLNTTVYLAYTLHAHVIENLNHLTTFKTYIDYLHLLMNEFLKYVNLFLEGTMLKWFMEPI